MRLTVTLAAVFLAAFAPPDPSAVFYGEWIPVNRVALSPAGGPDLSSPPLLLPSGTLVIMRDGIKTDARDTLTTEGYGELLYYIKECQKVSFAPRMWRDFAYQRLAAYDISAILRKFDRSSSYKSGNYPDDVPHDSGTPADGSAHVEIEITAEMVAAGAAALSHSGWFDPNAADWVARQLSAEILLAALNCARPDLCWTLRECR